MGRNRLEKAVDDEIARRAQNVVKPGVTQVWAGPRTDRSLSAVSGCIWPVAQML
jgi:hypothetical protein